MKKIFAIMMIICLLIAAFCINAFAADAPASDVVLRVSALKKDGSTVLINDYTDFAQGWTAAMEIADNPELMKNNDYSRVVVDLYADWNAENGIFGTEGKGFRWDTICFEEEVRMTVNLNGNTINRGLTDWEYNGEVIYIDEDADVIINDGTITGGFSCNGAGGIHIKDDANVVLNNVNIVGNTVEDDDGAGIAVYDGATLTMNGGKISNNKMTNSFWSHYYGGGVYVEDASASFYNVEFSYNANLHEKCSGDGIAIAMIDSSVVIDNCTFSYNGNKNPTTGIGECSSIVYARKSDLTIRNSNFLENGYDGEVDYMEALIDYYQSAVTLDGCNFKNNKQTYILYCGDDSILNVSNSDFTGNQSLVFCCVDHSESTFTDCKFDRGTPGDGYSSTFYNCYYKRSLHLINCESREATFYRKNNVDFQGGLFSASIFSEGSLTMVISFAALVASVASIGVNFALHKKKAVPATANNAAKTEEEDEE